MRGTPLVGARIAIIDASVLIQLIRFQQEYSLAIAFDAILVPDAVRKELKKGQARKRLRRLVKGGLYQPCSAANTSQIDLVKQHISRARPRKDRGESEAIVQAMERNVSVILVEDRKAQTIARRHGLDPMGLQALCKVLRLVQS
jgi:predicted nucleic acid-binding protein